jgi:hypothetical protein
MHACQLSSLFDPGLSETQLKLISIQWIPLSLLVSVNFRFDCMIVRLIVYMLKTK